ncbi:hypothetical protein BGZ83_006355 [Gryganskiella cystojenkinii]|nr:hypothetical protein BGZ83_006355 [Gryganskiella cystojenkinii]
MGSYRIFRRSYICPLALGSLIFLISLLALCPYLWYDFGYLTRPIWDKPAEPFDHTIIHFYADGMTMEERCEAHGWRPYSAAIPPMDIQTADQGKVPLVYDAIIFSVELDMLEIRMRETWDVVDYFVILESNGTFTGHAKEAVFADNRRRFEWAESKILYQFLPLYPLQKGEDAWVNEHRMRRGMTKFLEDSGIRNGDLATSSDVDETISKRTLELLKYCQWETPEGSIHLRLKNYLYSYEFPVMDEGIWETSVIKWTRGWHCSFCFRTIEDFQFKMQAYSHTERVRHRFMTEADYIQKRICAGKDLFGMFPEAYTFQELLARLGAIPKSHSAIGLPLWVVKNRDRFRFLLPGGCKRRGAFDVDDVSLFD